MTISSRIRLLVAVILYLLSAVALTGPARAQATNIAAELVAQDAVQPGETALLAIHMRPAPGWHGYWLNPGDAGLGMQLDWTLPPGFTAQEPRYPVPETLLISGLMNHVYKGDYAVLVQLTVPAGAKAGSTLPVTLDAQWLACTDEICVPESGQLQTNLTIGKPGAPDPRFETWSSRLPAPLDSPARFALVGNTLRLAIPLPASVALGDPHVFLAADRVATYAAAQHFSRNGDTLVIELERPRSAPANPEIVEGILRLGESGIGLSFTAMPGSVPAAGTPLPSASGTADIGALPVLLLGALLGGLLLNIMPCVFPILSLKALSLARAGESEAQARSEGLAYTAGVVAACLGLGALLLALRAGGEQVGWAFQLQEPGVIVLLLVLAAAITANFLGVFELALPGFSHGGSARGAFATGLLAAFVATPCTGPFMAAAMGAALLLPVIPAMALFAALGIGLALPFLLLAFVPALRRRLPRPGPWMNRFRLWMAVPMALTTLALLWLADRVGGMYFALGAALLAALVTAVLWVIGQRQRRGQSGGAIAVAGLALITIAGFTTLPAFVTRNAAVASPGILGAQPFSEAELAKARAAGKPVFVWMTADWCITCKVNEQAAIEREATAAAFAKSGVVVLRGDWTRRDPAITRYLTEQGAAGVPYYAWYPAQGGAPRQLPQVLTTSMLVELTGG